VENSPQNIRGLTDIFLQCMNVTQSINYTSLYVEILVVA